MSRSAPVHAPVNNDVTGTSARACPSGRRRAAHRARARRRRVRPATRPAVDAGTARACQHTLHHRLAPFGTGGTYQAAAEADVDLADRDLRLLAARLHKVVQDRLQEQPCGSTIAPHRSVTHPDREWWVGTSASVPYRHRPGTGPPCQAAHGPAGRHGLLLRPTRGRRARRAGAAAGRPRPPLAADRRT